MEENENIVLVIDEIHTLVGAGGMEGGADAANLLKPAMARGALQLIGIGTREGLHPIAVARHPLVSPSSSTNASANRHTYSTDTPLLVFGHAGNAWFLYPTGDV